jgi:hypothetical protein
MPKLHFGSRGGMYYRKNGRKVYVNNNNDFGSTSRSRVKSILNKLMNIEYHPDYDEEYIQSLIAYFSNVYARLQMGIRTTVPQGKIRKAENVIKHSKKNFY